tara:strand:- start:198 stop:428 length:231 start_codon:yes stop_codon:yes gene_type:complete
MNKRNNIIAKIGRQNTIRIFEAGSGRLMREIAVNGTICDKPVCEETDVRVEIISEGKKYMVKFNPVTGALKNRELV